MKNKLILYRVYTRKGEYHHSYSAILEGSLGWAIDCAKTIHGSVDEVYDSGSSKKIFDCTKQCSP